jgi:vacuolar-type H+-ATPase subunit H
VDEILEGILSIEAEAKAIVSEARELAAMLKEQAEEDAEEMRSQARKEAGREAEALRDKMRQEVEKERARILSQAQEEPQRAAEMDHFEQAVDFVVAVISGQGEETM